MFKGRSTIEIMILTFTFIVAFTLLGMTTMILVVKFKDPSVDIDRSIDALASFLSAIIGALLGLIAGKQVTNNEIKPPEDLNKRLDDKL